MALGRGLSSLIPKKHSTTPVFSEVSGEARKTSRRGRPKTRHDSIFYIEIEKITPNPEQPRREFEEESLKELAASISEHGILQPIIVSKISKDTFSGSEVGYQIIAGERRWRAAKISGLKQLPAIIHTASSVESLEMALVENIQRANLNPIDRAKAFKRLMTEFGLGSSDIAERISKSTPAVSNTVRLLELPDVIQDALKENKINEGHARSLLAVSNPEQRMKLFEDIIAHNYSVRDVEAQARLIKGASRNYAQRSNVYDPESAEIENKLREVLGTKVRLRRRRGVGKLVIEFYSDEELDSILKKIYPAV